MIFFSVQVFIRPSTFPVMTPMHVLTSFTSLRIDVMLIISATKEYKQTILFLTQLLLMFIYTIHLRKMPFI